MKPSFLTIALALPMVWAVSCSVAGQATIKPGSNAPVYFAQEEMPDLVKCLPAPPIPGSEGFAYDSLRYEWGKVQRLDPVKAETVNRDALWQLDSVIAIFSEPFGMEISKEKTPAIYEALLYGMATIELIRIQPKAYYHRERPFVRFHEHMLTTWEEEGIAGEGSYPSGHTIRGWSAAMILSEINPAAANALFERAWEYGESRVIAGAHWQSDVDASRPAASIGYAKLQTSKAFRNQVKKAKKEFRKLSD